ncbi:MAG: metallophosphoesterase [Candidatus Nanohaloarchaeota archaeon QJJ-5]|nr:metallophosphoesterase [Candidatus Nanohaloarchaeota archaeon QJJ-5]
MIGIVSDSHIPSRATSVPDAIREKLETAETVIHCGDFDRKSFYEQFMDWFPDAYCVSGNCDYLGLDSAVTFTVDDITFGVYHGSGIQPRGHRPTLANIAEEKLEVDVLFHGHTHTSMAARENGSILINPGSCTGVGGGSAQQSNPTMRTVSTDHGRLSTQEWTYQDDRLEQTDESVFEL